MQERRTPTSGAVGALEDVQADKLNATSAIASDENQGATITRGEREDLQRLIRQRAVLTDAAAFLRRQIA
jgi:hypothetical protein